MLSLIPGWDEPYVPMTDQALFELTVHDVGRHQVLLGPYSRFGGTTPARWRPTSWPSPTACWARRTRP